MKRSSATFDLSRVPKSGIGSFISSLAKENGVTYLETPHDKLAHVITRLSDDNVVLDEQELLLIALQRAGVIPKASVIRLQARYLNEKFGL